MRILVVGGGSGGHVTPVAAVCKELIKKSSDVELHFWCDKAFEQQARKTMGEVSEALTIRVISAGKLRRYHGLSLWRHISQVRTILLPNIIDGGRLVAGFIQSLYHLRRLRPDVVFTKGGFVCLPVGIAAHVLAIPMVIHDSDAHPGLTNRILARYATRIATGAPLEHYPYPVDISSHVGIPVAPEYKPVSVQKRLEFKKQFGFAEHEPLVVITGGGLGAKRLNDTIISIIDDLASIASIAIVAGAKNEAETRQALDRHTATNVSVYGYLSGKDMRGLMTASDIVVTRAGATTLLELAALHKPTIIVPNDLLTGGHQTKNAEVYRHAEAAIIVTESELLARPRILVDTVTATLLNQSVLRRLSKNIATLARPEAARDMADMILEVAKDTENVQA